VKTIKMTPQQWHEVLPNPRQRDTENRSRKAGHLRVLRDTHKTVFAAQLPGGALVKLDGHTRGYMWAHGLAEKPSNVDVVVIPVESMAEAKELYSHYDSDQTVEKARDKMFGAYREVAMSPVSGLIKAGPMTSALKKLGLATSTSSPGSGKKKSKQSTALASRPGSFLLVFCLVR
jgi:hypothetical protein